LFLLNKPRCTTYNSPFVTGWTALHETCNHGFVAAAQLLLSEGANVNAQGLDNDTPLHDAAMNGHPEVGSSHAELL